MIYRSLLDYCDTSRNAVNIEEGSTEGQGDENTYAVSRLGFCFDKTDDDRGLDNAGKTTIVKRIMDEDINTVSPTLGFIIKTIDYKGFVSYTVA